MERILVIGANGQIGSELVQALSAKYDVDNVIAADIAERSRTGVLRYEAVNVLDMSRLTELIQREEVTQVYQLAALLSANGEKTPLAAWTLNMNGLLNVLEIARSRNENGTPLRIFWPSSIAAFGPGTPRVSVPQNTVMDPITMYGISKLAGERLCEYYFLKFAVDVRSIRYPGIISHQAPPGGGTTDYTIEMLRAAKQGHNYCCYLAADSTLPMMYMRDAIRATLELMSAPLEAITVHSSYNVASMSFSPHELATTIQKHRSQFTVEYQPDYRQSIADSWPQSIDDSVAQSEWGWRARTGLDEMVEDMLLQLA